MIGRPVLHAPSFSPDGSRIAVQLGSALVVADVHGENRRDLAKPRADSNPVWSPDGEWIAFERKEVLGPTSIVVARADGGAERVLGEGTNPLWARGGTAIIATRPGRRNADDVPDPNEIWILDIGAASERKLAEGAYPSVSNDGTRIAFVRYTWVELWDEIYTASSTLLTVRLDGLGLRRIATRTGTEAAHFQTSTWLRGDTRLAVDAMAIDNPQLVVMSLRGDEDVVGGYSAESSAQSADGHRLAYVQDYPRHALIIRPRRSKRVVVSPPKGRAFSGPLSWSPDGSKVALLLRRLDPENPDVEYELAVVQEDGSDIEILADTDRFDGEPAWRPARPARPPRARR